KILSTPNRMHACRPKLLRQHLNKTTTAGATNRKIALQIWHGTIHFFYLYMMAEQF
ncbi:hypothetical protein ACJX0J_009570, partial [Zea mays]